MSKLIELENEYVLHTYNRNLVIVRGQGSFVWDETGKKYLDFTSGISVCSLGHCHPRVTAAITAQAGKLVHCSNYFINEHAPIFAQMLSERSFDGRCFFGNSGAEANEGLIKFARKWGSMNGGRQEIIAMDNSFHGRTLGTLAATGRAKYREGFGPDVPGFSFATFNDLASVERLLTPNTCAVMLETIQGEGGVIPAKPEFLKGLREFCNQHKLLLLSDEIQCGMARSGKWFAYQNYGITPDAMTCAKAIASGVPMGVFQIRREYEDVFAPGMHGTTFGGNPLATAAAVATLQTMEEEKVLDNVAAISKIAMQALNELKARYEFVKDVRGMGLMLGVELTDKETLGKITAYCREHSLLVLTAGETVLRLLPPLNIAEADMRDGLAIIADAFAAI